MKRALRTLAVTVPAAVLILAGTAAQAATWTHVDATGDATRVEYDLQSEGRAHSSPAPEDRAADITRLTGRQVLQRLRRLDDGTDTVRLTVPRSCMTFDDALRVGGRAQRPTLSPKVRVG